MNELQRIPERFGKNGYDFELIERAPGVALFRLSCRREAVVAWEVHKVRVMEERTTEMGGRRVHWPRREILAGNEEFGTYAWSFEHEDSARQKFQELTAGPGPRGGSKQRGGRG